jgi:hypothetical protein
MSLGFGVSGLGLIAKGSVLRAELEHDVCVRAQVRSRREGRRKIERRGGGGGERAGATNRACLFVDFFILLFLLGVGVYDRRRRHRH